MKITIEVEDIEQFAVALNNAVAVYGDIVWGIFIGCEIPSKFNQLKTIPYEEVKARQMCLLDVYSQVEKIEQKYKNARVYGEINGKEILIIEEEMEEK